MKISLTSSLSSMIIFSERKNSWMIPKCPSRSNSTKKPNSLQELLESLQFKTSSFVLIIPFIFELSKIHKDKLKIILLFPWITDQYIQLERRGYFKVDKIHEEGGKKVPELIFVPDGKSKGMSTITKNVNTTLHSLIDNISKCNPLNSKRWQTNEEDKTARVRCNFSFRVV